MVPDAESVHRRGHDPLEIGLPVVRIEQGVGKRRHLTQQVDARPVELRLQVVENSRIGDPLELGGTVVGREGGRDPNVVSLPGAVRFNRDSVCTAFCRPFTR